jgi:hypothetical protein
MTIITERMREEKNPGVIRRSFYVPGHELTDDMKQSLEENKALFHLFQRISTEDKKEEPSAKGKE